MELVGPNGNFVNWKVKRYNITAEENNNEEIGLRAFGFGNII